MENQSLSTMENQKSAIGLDGNLAAAIGYPIGIIALILIFIEKENKFVRFHAIQSILWGVLATIAWIVVFIVGAVLGLILAQILGATIAWGIWALTIFLFVVIFLGWFGGFIMAAVKAYGNNQYSLPIIGKYAAKWSA